MSERPRYYADVEACVEEMLHRLGRRVVLGAPLGLGKANHLVNEFYRRHTRIGGSIFTSSPRSVSAGPVGRTTWSAASSSRSPSGSLEAIRSWPTSTR